jgi:hypothetical protein
MVGKKRRPHTLSSEFTRILCISAHPDDNEFSIAGSVARSASPRRPTPALPALPGVC